MYKAKVRKTAPQTEPPAPRAASNEGRVSAPNSASLRADAASDPALAENMQSRISANFPGIDLLSRGSGRPLELPDDLRGSLEAHFGASLDNIHFRESSDAADLGAKAYARGDEIHFAPGQFRPDTEQGRKMIGHEVSHIRRQASGGMGNGVLLDDSLEHQADLDGAAIASGDAAPLQSVTAFAPMPVASFDAAPAQGWGLGEHGKLTELARKKASAYARTTAEKGVEPPKNFANLSVKERAAALESAIKNRTAYQQITQANEFDSDKAKRSLAYGAKFNDVGHHDTAGFLGNYLSHKSAFINQTHHGDMQFLHAMDTSGGDTKENMAKAQRYAQFASDVYQNKQDQSGQDVQSKNMLDYVLNSKDENGGEDTRFQEMMLSTMLSAKEMNKIDKSVAGIENEASRKRERMRMIREKIGEARAAKNPRKAGLSKYALGTVGDFFTGGDKDLDAGMVALGSASHMIEDSYAGSHASRAENLYLGDGGKKATDLSETGDEIAAKSTDVITSADYNQQDANPLWGRHPMGDAFNDEDGEIKGEDNIVDNTRGGALARDAAAQFMLMNAREKRGGEGGANDFIKKILKADDYAAGLQGGVTATGTAYAKKVGGSAFNIKEAVAASAFRDNTEARAENAHADAYSLSAQYQKRLNPLRILRGSKNEETKAHYMKQTNETLAHIHNMIQQLENAPQPLSEDNQRALRNLKSEKARILQQLQNERR